jgi:hypothetical protein
VLYDWLRENRVLVTTPLPMTRISSRSAMRLQISAEWLAV